MTNEIIPSVLISHLPCATVTDEHGRCDTIPQITISVVLKFFSDRLTGVCSSFVQCLRWSRDVSGLQLRAQTVKEFTVCRCPVQLLRTVESCWKIHPLSCHADARGGPQRPAGRDGLCYQTPRPSILLTRLLQVQDTP